MTKEYKKLALEWASFSVEKWQTRYIKPIDIIFAYPFADHLEHITISNNVFSYESLKLGI